MLFFEIPVCLGCLWTYYVVRLASSLCCPCFLLSACWFLQVCAPMHAARCFFIMCLTLECKCYVGQGHCFDFHCSYVLVEQSSHLVHWHTVLQSSLLVYKAECCSTTHSLLLIFHWLLSNTVLFWFRSCAYYSYFYFIICMTKIFFVNTKTQGMR